MSFREKAIEKVKDKFTDAAADGALEFVKRTILPWLLGAGSFGWLSWFSWNEWWTATISISAAGFAVLSVVVVGCFGFLLAAAWEARRRPSASNLCYALVDAIPWVWHSEWKGNLADAIEPHCPIDQTRLLWEEVGVDYQNVVCPECRYCTGAMTYDQCVRFRERASAIIEKKIRSGTVGDAADLFRVEANDDAAVKTLARKTTPGK